MSKILIVLGTATVVAFACCCNLLGGLISGVEFTPGNFPDVPPYPRSVQSTESNDALNAMTLAFNLIPGEKEWKLYKTGDSEGDVLDWYEDALPRHGWDEASGEDIPEAQTSNAAFFVKDETMLIIFAIADIDDTGDTYIVIGRIEIEE